MSEKVFKWDDLQRIILEQRLGQGQPVDDLPIAAGMLFARHGDNSIRRLHCDPEGSAHIELTYTADFSRATVRTIKVTPHAADMLQRNGLLRRCCEAEFGDRTFALNREGYRRVVEEWVTDPDLPDILKAGAIYDTIEHQLRWT